MFADKVIQTFKERDEKIRFYFDTDGSKKKAKL
jgi:hypothetical protein